MIRLGYPGPRSFILTLTCLPFRRFVTRTMLPKGRVRWAAVSLRGLNTSPLEVLCPALSLP
jgi:hypothetical protein